MNSDATAPRKSSATTKKIIFCAESRVLLPLIAIYMFFSLNSQRIEILAFMPLQLLLYWLKKKKDKKMKMGNTAPKWINRIIRIN